MSQMNHPQGAGDFAQAPQSEVGQNQLAAPQEAAEQAPATWAPPASSAPVLEQTNTATFPPPRNLSKDGPVVFSPQLWLGVALAVVAAILWFMFHSFEAIGAGVPSLPGIGTPIFVTVFFASLILVLGKRINWNRGNITLLAVAFAFSLIPVFFANQWLRTANFFLLTGLCIFTYFLLSGFAQQMWCTLATVGKSIAFFTVSLVRHWTKPFRALVGLRAKGLKGVAGIAFGFLIAGVLLLVVLPLLLSADSVFRDYFNEIGKWFPSLEPFDILWKTLRVVLVAPVFFSLIYAAFIRSGKTFLEKETHANATAFENPPKPRVAHVSPIPFATALIILDVVYLLFVVVQFAYLFGGFETSAINGGYAQYARSGFFQLVTVAFINLVVVLLTTKIAGGQGKRNIVLVVSEVLLLVCTVVILVSAFWRMNLYISVFGLSLLRALTLMGMVFILVCLIAAAIKVFQPKFVFFRVFFVAGVSLWLVFNFINVDARIAEYNVNGYLVGNIRQIDSWYLGNLSPDTLPALEKLAAEKPNYTDEMNYWKENHGVDKNNLPWYKWSASYVSVEPVAAVNHGEFNMAIMDTLAALDSAIDEDLFKPAESSSSRRSAENDYREYDF